MKALKNQEIKSIISADMVSKNRKGNYVARWGFFYTHGKTAQGYAERVAAKLENVNIIDKGQVWTPFKGGSPIQKSSHFWVEFNFDKKPETENKTIEILQHTVEYWHTDYDGELTECDIDHIEKCITEGYNQGELNTYIVKDGKDFEYRGWWKISK